MSTSNQYTDAAHQPLFGVERPRDRFSYIFVVLLTVIVVLETAVSAFIFPQWPPNGVNVFFAVITVLLTASHFVLILWYHQGFLEPKFRILIYYNTFVIAVLCICANLIFHKVGQ